MTRAGLVSIALAALMLSVGAASAQSPPQTSSPRPASSQPYPQGPGSLAGLWRMTGYKSSLYPPRERVARDVDGKVPPLLPWAKDLLEKRLTEAEHGKIFANSITLCLPEGMPYMLFSANEGPAQILETPGQVTVISEELNEILFVYLDQTHTPSDELEPTYHGESVGHWEGDALVVDTIGLNDKATLDQVGMPHSEALHLVTRIRRADADTLEFLVTVDDPKTFAAPWTRKVIYKKAAPGERIREYVCDNNRNAPNAEGFQAFDDR